MSELKFEVQWLDLISYEEGLRLQEELVLKKIEGDSTNYLLLLEHKPVYTIGRTRDVSSLGTEKLPYPLHQIGRGGQATYHGPGQLVAYPIIDLHLLGCDLHCYLRLLEEAIIELLKIYTIEGIRRKGMTGVWIKDKKIASLGVGVRKWVSFHGLALNVCGDLSPFKKITPCGLSGVSMTSIEKESESDFPLPRISWVSVEGVGRQLEKIFISLLNSERKKIVQ